MSTDALTGSGLQLEDLTDITNGIIAGLQTAYGVTINVNSNSPDGQMIGIFAQAAEDLRELLLDVYNSFDVDSAYGVLLDQRVALNGVTRNPGTYTQAYVAVTANGAGTLPGLDVLESNPGATVFTVSDSAGNQYQLVTSYTFSGSGTETLQFQAVDIGQVVTQPNTITGIVMPFTFVTSVNNPSTGDDLIGQNEETDAQLKVRRANMFYLAADGPAASVAAAILSVPGVVDAYVYENDTGSAVGVVPANGIYVVVNGGAAAAIGQAIYSKKAPGCAMYGSQSYAVSRPNSQTITVYWDNAVVQNFYAEFGITPVTGSVPSDSVIAAALAAALNGFYHLNQTATIGDIVTAMLALYPNAYITAVGVSSDGMTYGDTVVPAALDKYLVLPAANITVT